MIGSPPAPSPSRRSAPATAESRSRGFISSRHSTSCRVNLQERNLRIAGAPNAKVSEIAYRTPCEQLVHQVANRRPTRGANRRERPFVLQFCRVTQADMTNKLAILVNLGTPGSPETGATRSRRGSSSRPARRDAAHVSGYRSCISVLTFRLAKSAKNTRDLAGTAGCSPTPWPTGRQQAAGQGADGTRRDDAWAPCSTTLRGRDFLRTNRRPRLPQYSGSITGAVYDRVGRILARTNVLPNLQLIMPITPSPATRGARGFLGDADPGHTRVLLSRHSGRTGAKEPYEAQCRETASAVAAAAGLSKPGYSPELFGPAPWLQPYTEDIDRVAKAGRPVRVICPASPSSVSKPSKRST